VFLVFGAWAFADPESFFDEVATFEPYNQHLIQDVGAFQIGLGAVLLIAAGVALVVADRRLPRLGARYSARPEQAATDPDRATWEALDAGVDPTVEAGDAGAGRSDGGGSGGNV
jgi:hypothetical protein